MDGLPPFLLALGLPLGLSLLLTPAVGRFARRYGFLDHPSPRREPVLKPRLGGVAIYLAFVLALVFTAPLVGERTPAEVQRIWGLMGGATVLLLLGALDDRYELGWLPQMVVQVLVAGLAMASGVLIDRITNPFGSDVSNSLIHFPGVVAVGFTLFWIVGAMNTMNFIDGLDGLAAGITGIAAGVLFFHSLRMGQDTIAVLPLSLLGAVLGFLPSNAYPAKVTLGTSGSVFLGYSLGTLSIIGGTKAATLLLVLGVPIVDTAWLILSRLVAGRSPFQADRAHLHHRLMELGLSPRHIVWLIYGTCALFGVLALVLSSRLMKLYALVGMGVLVVGVLALLAHRGLRERG